MQLNFVLREMKSRKINFYKTKVFFSWTFDNNQKKSMHNAHPQNEREKEKK